jgi:hypothetical protein
MLISPIVFLSTLVELSCSMHKDVFLKRILLQKK